MEIELVRLSVLLRSRLVDQEGERLGRLDDVVVRLAEGHYPPVTGLKARLHGNPVYIPAGSVARLAPRCVRLADALSEFAPFEQRAGDVLLHRDVFGRRLINVVGARLVRAHDLVLACVDGPWRVVGLDTDLLSRLVGFLPGALDRRDPARPFLDWLSVEPFLRHIPTAQLHMAFGRLARLHPAEIARLVETASAEEGDEIVDTIGASTKLEASVLGELDAEHQVALLEGRSDIEAAALLAEMEADDAADLLGHLSRERRTAVLRQLPDETRRRLLSLLEYNPRTAGGLMTTDLLALRESSTVEHALDALRRSDLPARTVATVFTLDPDERLTGAVAMTALLRSNPRALLAELKSPAPLVLSPDADASEVALGMTDYDMHAAPVVDESGRVVGIVTADDVLKLVIRNDWRRRLRALGE
jgi:CBS domain-containing protein